ncbi:MAG: 3-coathanger stack domain-containing protein [Leadbetterella sp.]
MKLTKYAVVSILFLAMILIPSYKNYAQVVLSGTNYTQNFDNIGSGLPAGWTVRTGATATTLGTAGTLTTAHTSWTNTSGNFRNCGSSDGTNDAANTDRSLAIRQTGTFGDPGGAFLAQIQNTSGFQNFQLSLKIQSLDAASARTTTWLVQWAVGPSPSSFNTLTTLPASITTGGSIASNVTVSTSLPSSIDNQTENVWIRIVTLSGTTGSGSRATTGIDDFSLNYSSVATNTPTISTSGTLVPFVTTENTASSVQNYTVSGSNLSSDITIIPPPAFEISLSASNGFIGFPNALVLPQNNGVVTPTLIYVLLKDTLAGSYNANLSHTSTGANSINIPLIGTVNPNLNNPTPIATARSLTQGTVVTVAGRVTVAQQFGGLQIFIQDSTGGISVFRGTGNIVQENGLVLGDSIQVQGVLGNFNQLIQINPTQINKIATTPILPQPKLIQASQILANEGRLVRINDVNIPGILSIAGQTNYFFSPAQVRILNSTNTAGFTNPLVGTSLQAGTGYITGIAGRFNTTAQLLPRLTTDIVRTGDPLPGSTDSTFANTNTLDVVCWNIEWFGSTGFGPTNEALQLQNAKTIIKTLNADIYNLNEIASVTAFNTMVAQLNTEGFAYSGICSNRTSNNDTISGQRVCFLYKTASFSNVTTKHIFETLDNQLDANIVPAVLSNYPDADKTRFWASGRLPFALNADVTIGSNPPKNMTFIGVHARANTGTTPAEALSRYNMRKFDVEALKDTLDAQYATQPFVLLGDYNDDLDLTVATTAGVPGNVSSYAAYNLDTSRYSPQTRVLSDAGQKSTVGFSDMIDHIISSNELSPSYITNSSRVGTPEAYIVSFGTTTSDHYPVMARFNIGGNCTPNQILTASINTTGLLKIEASNTIIATNKILAGVPVIYDAQNSILLNPGFEITSSTNTVFRTQLDGCGGL